MILILEFNRKQMQEIFRNANEIALNLESKLENLTTIVTLLHLTTTNFFQEAQNVKFNDSLRIKYIDNMGRFSLDNNGEVNLFGCEEVFRDKKVLFEMQSALRLAPMFKLAYKKNKNFAWIYYYSKHHFIVLFPYVSSKDFKVTKALEKKAFFEYATPSLNPNRKLFFTPLYMDEIGKGLMISIGKPVYVENEFLGTVDVDITLNNLDNILSRLDYLNNQSFVYNKQHQIVASSNLISDFNRSRIYKINDFVSLLVSNIEDTDNTLKYSNSKYIYAKRLAYSEFHFVYMINAYKVWSQSILYDIPIFFLMLFTMYLFYLFSKTRTLNKKLKLQTIRDYMTGTYNRRYFFEVAEASLLKAQRKNTNLAIIMMDIDDFKNINDTFGHDIGDIAICEVKNILERNLRKYDLFARFGGEEFCVLMEESTKEDVQRLFEKIRKEFEQNEIISGDVHISYTVSFGIAYGISDSLKSFIKTADEALYISKHNGKNQVTIYEV